MQPHAKNASDSPAAQAARRWRAALPGDLRRSSTARGLFVVGLAATIYLATFLGMFLMPTWWSRLLSLFVCPVAIGMLFVIGHDAAHNSLTPIGWLNRILGRLVMLPAYHPYTSWSHAHNTLHHGWTNFASRHPDFPPFSKEQFDRLPIWRRLLERFYRTPVGIGPFYTFDFYFRFLVFPSRAHCSPYRAAFQLDRLLVFAFLIAQLTTAYLLTAYTPEMILPRAAYAIGGTAIAWTSWIWFMGFVSYVQHTHPRMAWYRDEAEWTFYHVQLRSTAHVVFPWPIERLLNNIMDHPAHHLDPVIPLYNLTAAQKLLEEMSAPHAVVYHWTPWDYFRTCSACKLYDFDRHCWTDFDGVPTSPPNLPDLPRPAGEKLDERQPESPAGEVPAA